MRSNRKHTAEELEEFILLYNQGVPYRELKIDYGLLISESSFNQYLLKYQEHGISSLESSRTNHTYSREFKEKVVQEHLRDHVPVKQLARKYAIPSDSTARNWVIQYTEGEQLKEYAPNPEVYTMKSQKKTQEEKVEIVKDFLKAGMSYRETAEKYHVSYNNVYSWVQKYKKHGPDGLIDSRGRRKPNQIQTNEERLQTENAALRARNEYLETENAALKKWKKVERELMLQEQDIKQNIRRSKD